MKNFIHFKGLGCKIKYFAYISLSALIFCIACSSNEETSKDEAVLVDTYSVLARQQADSLKQVQSARREIQIQIMLSAKRCQINELWQCQTWLKTYQDLTYDLRQVKKFAANSLNRTQTWIELAVSLLDHDDIKMQSIGAELLTIVVERLKFRFIPKLSKLKDKINKVINTSDQPLQKSKLIMILNHLLPLGDGEVFYRFTDGQEDIEVQMTAWQVLAQRHSQQESIKFKKVQKAMKLNPSLSVKASLIKAIIPLKSSKVIHWCGKEWWRNELYIPCRDAISTLESERASYELWRWIKSIFEEFDQTISADLMIAEALTYLSPNVRSQRSQRRYRKLLDKFFKRRRTEKAAILVAESWLELPSTRYALEISLRYFRPKIANITAQSHFFEQALKRIIYQLSNPLNIDK
ncbi:MAG: hypothetical protein CMH49_03175 [Myxococcales bacterium]|nr:hypothetical protein [Myxococcales bacterium]